MDGGDQRGLPRRPARCARRQPRGGTRSQPRSSGRLSLAGRRRRTAGGTATATGCFCHHRGTSLRCPAPGSERAGTRLPANQARRCGDHARGGRPARPGHREPHEAALTAFVAGKHGVDLGGRTSLPTLAGLLAGAACVVAGNTGPAHLAAAVGTPVVGLFAPTVPFDRWRPFGVPVRRLGDQSADCADTRATVCPIVGHPCLSTLDGRDIAAAVEELTCGIRELARPCRMEFRVRGGDHHYLVPVLPDRGPYGRGRPRTYEWPKTPSKRSPPSSFVTATSIWSCFSARRRSHSPRGGPAGRLPAVYLEHHAPGRHPGCASPDG